MIYTDMPIIIPVLATIYLLTIYLLLTVAQRKLNNSRYFAKSLTDAYLPYISVDYTVLEEELESSKNSSVQELGSLR